MRMPHEMAHEITPGGGPTRSNGSIAVSTHQQHQLLARGQGEAGGLGVCVLGRGVGCDAARHKPQLMFALDAAAVLGAAPHIVALQPHYTHQPLIVPDNAPPPSLTSPGACTAYAAFVRSHYVRMFSLPIATFITVWRSRQELLLAAELARPATTQNISPRQNSAVLPFLPQPHSRHDLCSC
jgi:hypothetical protein